MMLDTKFNYIIAGGGGFYLTAYRDLFDLENVSYHVGYANKNHNYLVNLLLRVDFNLNINRFIKTPFRKITFPLLFPHNFCDKRNLCYIFFESQFSVINTGYLEYLRATIPGVKLVLYMQDIVASLPYYNIENYKKRFDLVVSYDKGDCIKYGLEYYPTPYSTYNGEIMPTKDIDLFFCGAAKTRYDTIFSVYKACTMMGLKCLFYITGVPEGSKIVGDGLVYDTPITYEENISFVKRSKCILEVMQKNADGYTPRLWEALFYGTHLLTNNTTIKDSEYYQPQSIHFINKMDDINSWIDETVTVDEELIRSKSPISFLNFIENKLC